MLEQLVTPALILLDSKLYRMSVVRSSRETSLLLIRHLWIFFLREKSKHWHGRQWNVVTPRSISLSDYKHGDRSELSRNSQLVLAVTRSL